ncbi:MAG: sel1 repeat family protein [Selenomonadaceae bacterium]|nr:sel1 repeat family protein [Selenomonadaceae bacterium]
MANDNTRENIKLVAKLLNADKSNRTNCFGESREAFYDEFGKNFRAALEESSVPDKAEIFDGIFEIANDMEIFGAFPELLGKTFVGVVGFDKHLTETFMSRILDERAAKNLMLDTNLPVILVAGDEGISAVNDIGNPVDLSLSEYSKTNISLWRDKIEVPQILQFFLLKRAGFFQNIALIYFPEHFDSRTPFAEMIFQKLDAVTIFISEPPDKKNKQKLLDEFFKLKNRRPIPFNFCANTQIIGELMRDNRFREVSFHNTEEIFRVFERLNVVRENCFFADAITGRLLEIRNFYEQKINQLKTDRSQIAEDLVRLTVDETKSAVRDLQAENRRELHLVEQEFEKLRGASTLLLDLARKYESEAEKYFGRTTAHCSEAAKEIWRKIFFQATDLRDFKLAAEYARKLNRFDEAYGYVCEIILHTANNEFVGADKLERLRRESDNEFIRRAKLRAAENLRFSDYDCMQISRDINSIETAKENYFRGLWEEHAGDKKSAVNYFKRALKQGYSRAGTKLFELAGGNFSALQILSDQMVPEANFALGNMSLAENRYAAALRYFKLAAVKNFIPAIKFLVDDFSAKLLKAWHSQHNLSSTEKTQAQSCIEIYGMILKNSSDVSSKERVGDLYQALGDDRRALSWWTQCNTADSCYKCGRLYQYTDGTFEQDLDTAERFFSQAADKGHAKARTELTKVRQWKASNIQKEKARQAKKQTYAPRVETVEVKSSGGLCVITSAACAALNKPDDCEELNTLRAYRDKMKATNPVVAALVKEYYRVAPLLVKKINAEVAAKTIYSSLWENFIERTYNLILAGENEAATAIYIDMVQELCKRYDVQLSEETLENIRRLNLTGTRIETELF